jgi:hypothetical protein
MSKFSGLLQAKALPPQPSENDKQVLPVAPAVLDVKPVAEVSKQQATAKAAPSGKTEVIDMQPGRGKKGHQDYNQVTIYLRKETHNKAKIALLQNGDKRDFSELVEDLLKKFLDS